MREIKRDEEGNKMNEQNLGEGAGIEIFEGGEFGDFFDLNDMDRDEWRDVSEGMGDLRGAGEKEKDFDAASSDAETRDEQKDDLREEDTRNTRKDIETPRDN